MSIFRVLSVAADPAAARQAGHQPCSVRQSEGGGGGEAGRGGALPPGGGGRVPTDARRSNLYHEGTRYSRVEDRLNAS